MRPAVSFTASGSILSLALPSVQSIPAASGLWDSANLSSFVRVETVNGLSAGQSASQFLIMDNDSFQVLFAFYFFFHLFTLTLISSLSCSLSVVMFLVSFLPYSIPFLFLPLARNTGTQNTWQCVRGKDLFSAATDNTPYFEVQIVDDK